MGPDATLAKLLALGALLAACSEPASSSDVFAIVEPGVCTDVAPSEEFTCGQQLAWGKCDEPWMQGRCDRTCGRCTGIGNATDTCSDVSPGGPHSCAQQAAWGKCDEPWMEGFCQVSCDRCPISAQLIDPAASKPTRKLMSYLVSTYRDAIISGQHGRAEADVIGALTGHHPAILGLDFMDYSPSRVAYGAESNATDDAIEWSHDQGGIVTVVWHWNAPANLLNTKKWPWWKGFYTSATTFDLARAISDLESAERQLIMRDIDAIGAELQRLEKAGVPVLWRPIHEAAGGWFWWGAHGRDVYVALWRLLYDRLVNHHGLHNLIWVWNGQDADWYPGDQYVDIVGEDIYDTARDYQPQEDTYLSATRYGGMPKLAALTETGVLPDPDRLVASRARWSWFMLWSGDFASTEVWNEGWMKEKVYASDFVITLDELPAL